MIFVWLTWAKINNNNNAYRTNLILFNYLARFARTTNRALLLSGNYLLDFLCLFLFFFFFFFFLFSSDSLESLVVSSELVLDFLDFFVLFRFCLRDLFRAGLLLVLPVSSSLGWFEWGGEAALSLTWGLSATIPRFEPPLLSPRLDDLFLLRLRRFLSRLIERRRHCGRCWLRDWSRLKREKLISYLEFNDVSRQQFNYLFLESKNF